MCVSVHLFWCVCLSVSLCAAYVAGMDRATYEKVAEIVGAAPSEGLTPSHLAAVYLKYNMGNVAEDWSQISGAPLPQPRSEAAAAGTRDWLLAELERLRSAAFAWQNAEHTEALGRVWSVAAPPAESITAEERVALPQRLELLVSLPLFMGFGSRMAQVRLANALEEVAFADGENIVTEGEPVDASACMCVSPFRSDPTRQSTENPSGCVSHWLTLNWHACTACCPAVPWPCPLRLAL